jgi:excisionase family DNA binding protein
MASTGALLTPAELAERLHVSPDTLRRWARRGRIPVIRASTKVLRFDLDAVLAALRMENGRRGDGLHRDDIRGRVADGTR